MAERSDVPTDLNGVLALRVRGVRKDIVRGSLTVSGDTAVFQTMDGHIVSTLIDDVDGWELDK